MTVLSMLTGLALFTLGFYCGMRGERRRLQSRYQHLAKWFGTLEARERVIARRETDARRPN